jgi:putative addiction module killer protein
MYPEGYFIVMNSFQQTPFFANWLMALKDPVGKARILARLKAAELGHFGDCGSVGHGVLEMRIHYGPGYRVYFTRRAEVTYLLLVAGDKSTQKRDIEHARQLAKNL